jgi:hypothetical protein
MIQPACQQRLAFTKKSLCEKYREEFRTKKPIKFRHKKRQYLGHWTPNISEIFSKQIDLALVISKINSQMEPKVGGFFH